MKISHLLEKADEEIMKHKLKLKEKKRLKGEGRKIQEFLVSWASA